MNCKSNTQNSLLSIENEDKIALIYRELKTLNDEIAGLKSNMTYYINNEATLKPLLMAVGTFFATMIFVLVIQFILSHLYLDQDFASTDMVSSWFALVALIGLGLVAAIFFYNQHPILGILTAIAWGGMFTDYFGYVFYNYGFYHPHLSAIGFNIFTILQSFVIVIAAVDKKTAFLKRLLSLGPIHDQY